MGTDIVIRSFFTKNNNMKLKEMSLSQFMRIKCRDREFKRNFYRYFTSDLQHQRQS